MKNKFLVDEDLPRSLANDLNKAGFEAVDVRDVGLRGKSDRNVFDYACQHSLSILSADVGFANLLQFPLGSHSGIIVARLPNEFTVLKLKETIVRTLKEIAFTEIAGNLIIIEQQKIRVRRKPTL